MINDNFLTAIAKVMNSESTNMPSHLAYGSSTMTIETDSSSLTDEYSNRDSVSGSRSGTVVTFNGLRSGTVAGSAGDTLYTVGLYDSVSGGNLMSAVLTASILQTTSFDIDIDWQFSITRAS